MPEKISETFYIDSEGNKLKVDFTDDEVKKAFQCLFFYMGLAKDENVMRFASDPSEFMLMHEDTTHYHFKHNAMRFYVHVDKKLYGC